MVLYQDTNDSNYSEPSGGWKWVNGASASIDGFNLNGIALSIEGGTASLTTTIPISVTASGSLSYLFELPLSGEVSGQETLTIGIVSDTLLDAEGNYLSSVQTNNKVQLRDTTAPKLSLFDDYQSENISGGTTVTIITISDETLIAPPVLAFSDQSSVSMTTATNAKEWIYEWIVPTEVNDTISITVMGYDVNGNSSTSTNVLVYEIDNLSAEVNPYHQSGQWLFECQFNLSGNRYL